MLKPSDIGPDQEQHEVFTFRGREYVQYDYRARDGELFSTVAPGLGTCRERMREWLKKRARSNA